MSDITNALDQALAQQSAACLAIESYGKSYQAAVECARRDLLKLQEEILSGPMDDLTIVLRYGDYLVEVFGPDALKEFNLPRLISFEQFKADVAQYLDSEYFDAIDETDHSPAKRLYVATLASFEIGYKASGEFYIAYNDLLTVSAPSLKEADQKLSGKIADLNRDVDYHRYSLD
jgi:hypothetical protein